MAIHSTNLVRSSFGQSAQRLLSLINSHAGKLDEVSAQMAGGRRILSASQDPSGAASWLAHQSLLKRNEVFAGNAVAMQQRYDFADSQLGQAGDILSQLKSIALRESNATADAGTRASSALEVGNLRSALLALANSEFSGANLFAGRKLTGPGFEAIGDSIRFLGTPDTNQVQVGNGVTISQNLDARRAFGVGTNVITGGDLNAAATLAVTSPTGSVTRSTPLASLNGGRGVDLAGTVRISVQPDGALGNTREFTFGIAGAETLEDVVVAINNIRDESGGRVFDATMFTAPGSLPQDGSSLASGIRIRALPGGSLSSALAPSARVSVSDDPGRTTARDLGLLTSTFTHSFETEDISAQAPFSGSHSLEFNVNGRVFTLVAVPSAPGGLPELAASIQALLPLGMSAAGITGVSASVTATASGLHFAVTDDTGGGYFGVRGTNPAGERLRLPNMRSVQGPSRTSGSVRFTDALGVVGADLDVALHWGTRLADLFGGQGLTLETDALGNTRLPQGLRISNGNFHAAVNLEPLVNDSNATLGDLKAAVERAGVHVELRLAPRGLELASLLSASALKVQDHNGSLATQLGLVTATPAARTSDLNNGLGIDRAAGTDFTLSHAGGVTVHVDIGEASTPAAIAEAINASPENVNPSGGTYFTAGVFRQRSFESLPVSPDAAIAFDVSMNGREARSVSIAAQPGRTLDQLAVQMQAALNDAAWRAGLDGYFVRVSADMAGGYLGFDVEDASGTARVAFAGGSTGLLGLAGQMDASFEARLRNEHVADRIAIRDNLFVPGSNPPTLSPYGAANTATDLGLAGSFDALTGRFVSADLRHRGQGDEGMFAVLADLQAALHGNSQSAIARQIDRLEAAYTGMLDLRAEAGGASQRAQMAQGRLIAESEHVSMLASNIMDTDLAAAAQQFAQLQTALQAGMAAAGAIGRITLFDYL